MGFAAFLPDSFDKSFTIIIARTPKEPLDMRFDALKRFFLDETGAVSVDAVVVIGGSILIAQTVITDISEGMVTLSDKMNARFEQIAVDQLDNAATVYTPTSSTTTPAQASAGPTAGNPGNDKAVGNAGENPNGSDDWGDGTQGKSQ
ncbi:MAG TPA: hypothetical protein DEO85_09065 [Maritimibacter sp.]|nr:hypothetical protein [Maritimibacter sp.]